MLTQNSRSSSERWGAHKRATKLHVTKSQHHPALIILDQSRIKTYVEANRRLSSPSAAAMRLPLY